MNLKELKKVAKRNGIDPIRISHLEHTKDYLITHEPDQCLGQTCTVHNRSDHSMRDFPQHFRWDTGVMERTCPHGRGHPDPDGPYEEGAWQWVHGCDGCCNPDSEVFKINYGV